ncbi:recombinase family protein [Microvirga sp. GCM10011540]|uniref:recombinase family protein n=1 Tax=Microvirga sp. GCM10011540 TaxID=3317338 RepID=UPI003618690B
MAEGKFVAYYRVSTEKQGRSGLGLEAQQKAVRDYLNGGSWDLCSEIIEVESGKNSERPKLQEALMLCRLYGATLIIAKLDRLSRDAHFLLGLEKAGADFVAADMPSANRVTVRIMAVLAEEERNMISERTKAALAAAKARGVRLGGDRGNLQAVGHDGRRIAAERRRADAEARAHDLAPQIKQLQAQGLSLRGIASQFEERGYKTPRGGKWTATQVSRVLRNCR